MSAGWSTPGGSIDVDEVPEVAARREVLEETDLHVRVVGIVTVLGGPEFRKAYKNGDEVAVSRSRVDVRNLDLVLML